MCSLRQLYMQSEHLKLNLCKKGGFSMILSTFANLVCGPPNLDLAQTRYHRKANDVNFHNVSALVLGRHSKSTWEKRLPIFKWMFKTVKDHLQLVVSLSLFFTNYCSINIKDKNIHQTQSTTIMILNDNISWYKDDVYFILEI